LRILAWRPRREPVALDVSTAYARWAPTYPQRPENELMRLEHREVLRLLPPLSGRRLLDLGCGTGRYLIEAAARRAALAVGLDPAPAMLARAAGLGAPLVAAALPALPFADSSFDAAVCGLVLGHLPELGPALAEVARVLRPGGVAVYSDLHPAGARHGWRRTFLAADARTYAVHHVVHAYEAHLAACAAAGLVVDEVAEPRVERVRRWKGVPAALVIRAVRPSGGGR
jgi:malonyl-CoA O-methyltransferase